MRRLLPVSLVVVLLALAACTAKEKPAVAIVGGAPISRDDFQDELRRVRAETGDLILQKEVLSALKASVLNQMIEKRLVLNEAAAYGVDVSEAEVDGQLRRLQADYPENGFDQSAKENFVNLKQLRTRIHESLTMDRVAEQALGRTLTMDEEELVRYFRAHAGEFAQEERVHLRQIVVRTREEAEALRVRVLAGESFLELAKKNSLTPDAAKGGDIGIFAKGEMPPEFNQAFNLAVGEVSPVVQSSYGYHLFWVVEKLPSKIPQFEDVRTQVQTRFMQERKENAYRTWVKQLRDKAGVRIFQDIVDSVD